MVLQASNNTYVYYKLKAWLCIWNLSVWGSARMAISLTWSLGFYLLLLLCQLLLLKTNKQKLKKKRHPTFSCSLWTHILLIFFLLASKQFLITSTMRYVITLMFKFWKLTMFRRFKMSLFRFLGCSFVCQICLKLSSSWNVNLKWISIFSCLMKTCCFYLKLIHNSSSEMLLLLSGFTWMLEIKQISVDFECFLFFMAARW